MYICCRYTQGSSIGRWGHFTLPPPCSVPLLCFCYRITSRVYEQLSPRESCLLLHKHPQQFPFANVDPASLPTNQQTTNTSYLYLYVRTYVLSSLSNHFCTGRTWLEINISLMKSYRWKDIQSSCHFSSLHDQKIPITHSIYFKYTNAHADQNLNLPVWLYD